MRMELTILPQGMRLLNTRDGVIIYKSRVKRGGMVNFLAHRTVDLCLKNWGIFQDLINLNEFERSHSVVYWFYTFALLIHIFQSTQLYNKSIRYTDMIRLNLLTPELFFKILAHPAYKMWIIQEPNMLELRNKLHFKEEKTESI